MKQEYITIREQETTARVQTSQVQAVRLKDVTKKGVRVYKDGKIGISGAVGEASQEFLLESAVQNLSAGIEYPYALTSDYKDHRSYKKTPISAQELLDHAEEILATLRKDYPDFSFSEYIATNEIQVEMRNSEGLDLQYQDAFFVAQLILKEKATANLFDGGIVCQSRQVDLDQFLRFNRDFLEAYRNKVDLPKGDVLPVFTMDTSSLGGFLGLALHGERFAKGSSLFSGKCGQRLFSEQVTLDLVRDPVRSLRPFFDSEGVVLPGDCLSIIEQGRLARVLTDKKTAQIYNLPHTGSAIGAYDDPPTIDGAHGQSLAFRTDSQDIAGFLKGQRAIFAFICSGGDFTADGSYATPVQVSFLFDGERLLGKLPEFTMRSHIDKMLGEDYIGTFDNTVLYMGDVPTQLQGYNMRIMR